MCLYICMYMHLLIWFEIDQQFLLKLSHWLSSTKFQFVNASLIVCVSSVLESIVILTGLYCMKILQFIGRFFASHIQRSSLHTFIIADLYGLTTSLIIHTWRGYFETCLYEKVPLQWLPLNMLHLKLFSLYWLMKLLYLIRFRITSWPGAAWICL